MPMPSPTPASHAAYDALMRDLLKRAAARIARQEVAASVSQTETAAAKERNDGELSQSYYLSR